MRVAIFGLGYVGTVTAAGLASQGHDVVGVDVERSKVAAIRRGESPVVEPGVDRLVAQAVSAGRLRATTDVREAIEGADVSLVCVGTPSTPRGDTNLTYISRALADLREAMADVAPPASGFHSVGHPVDRAARAPGAPSSSPRSAPSCCPTGGPSAPPCAPSSCARGAGSTTSSRRRSWSSAPRTRAPGRPASELFDFLDQEIRHVDVASAEALKYACNAFHAVKVTFANEMGRIFSQYGVDSRERHGDLLPGPQAQHLAQLPAARVRVRRVLPAQGPAGPAEHGARRAASTCPSLSSTLISNEILVRALVDRVLETGYRHVALLGLSFKMNTDDLRESPNLELAERFVGKGFEVRIYDPIVNPAQAGRRQPRAPRRASCPHVSRLLRRPRPRSRWRASRSRSWRPPTR